MSLKKTDMFKSLGKKVDGKMKAAEIPQRFAKGSTTTGASKSEARIDRQASEKMVAVACRLPANLVNQLREHALHHPGGFNALMADAVSDWLKAHTQI